MAKLATSENRGRGASGHSRCVSALLMFVNLVLAAYAGAALLTAARLRLDPTTSMLAERIFPTKFEEVARDLPIGGAALLLLTHLAVLALYTRGWCRRILLFLYAILMLALVAMEAVIARGTAPEGRQELEAAQGHVHTVLMYSAKTVEQLPPHIIDVPNIVENVVQDVVKDGQDAVQGVVSGGLPDSFPQVVKKTSILRANLLEFTYKFQRILREIENDISLNINIATNASIGLAVLQVVAAMLALVAALGRPSRPIPRDQLLEPQ